MTTKLFESASINGLTLRNRIIMPPMLTHFASINGEVTDRLIAYLANRAEGGVGLLIPEAMAVAASGLAYFPGLSIAHDRYIKGLKKLAGAVHARGGRIGAQLGHAGRFAQPAVSRMPRQLVSFISGWCSPEESHVLEDDEIEELAQNYADAAVRAASAGFDLVEIHGAHGYLIGQFLSPFFNRRTDRWGGSLENRMAFPLLVLQKIRKELGGSFPISFRISSDEFIENGLKLPESIEIARTFAKAGADLIHVSAGIIETNRFTGPPPCLPKGWNSESAAAIREAVLPYGAKVSVAGRIHDLASAEQILEFGQADFVSIGRALIADPFLPNKLVSGREDMVTPCLSCNEGCIGSIARKESLKCAVNPLVGQEMLAKNKTSREKKVFVVGGGISGLAAALEAKRSGHDVTLFEKTSRLGGLLNVAALPPHKELFFQLTENMLNLLKEAGVKICLNHEVTARELLEARPDEVLVATGSKPVIPGFIKNSSFLTAQDVLEGKPVGQNVLIIGGGMVGAETAEFLAAQGKEITILEMRDSIAPDMQVRARIFLLETLKKAGVKFLLETQILGVAPDGTVKAKDKWDNEFELGGYDAIVIAVGYKPEKGLCAELAKNGIKFTPLGDCVHAGKVMTAIQQAWQIANAI